MRFGAAILALIARCGGWGADAQCEGRRQRASMKDNAVLVLLPRFDRSHFSRMRFCHRGWPLSLRSTLPRSFAAAFLSPLRAHCAAPRAVLRLLACAAFLAACSPAYNWRTVADPAEGYEIDLPAKPTVDERSVDIAGRPLPMHVRAAHTQGAVFAIAAIDLPRDDAQLQQSVIDALRSALARNLGTSPLERAVQVPLSAGATAPGIEIVATGAAGPAHEQRTIHAWIVGRGRHVYQAAIVAAHAPPQEQSDQFFGSLKVR